MSVLFIVLPLALIFAAGAVLAFIWAARHGQFDDLITPSIRILDDQDAAFPTLIGPSEKRNGTAPPSAR